MDDYEIFKEKVLKLTGLNLSSYKEKQMKRRITSLANRNGYKKLVDYFELINSNDEKFEEFINFLTINVSEFYRNPEQWKIVSDVIFPNFLKEKNYVKVWSAACSTGEEPYTIAMILSTLGVPYNKIDITATDIDDGALEKAKIGVYSKASLKNVPPNIKNKFFKETPEGNFAISSDIKNSIKFKKHNLLKDSYDKNYDIIVCRNVMIYFTDEAKNIIYQKYSESLQPNGILFVGSTEQIISPHKFNLKSLRTFFYGREDGNAVI